MRSILLAIFLCCCCTTIAQASGYQLVQMSSWEPVRAKPSVTAKTGFAVKGAYWVIDRHGSWLGISSFAHHRGLSWVNTATMGKHRFMHTTRIVVIDRSARILRVIQNGRTIRRWHVGVGAPRTPTPLGKTSVEGLWKPSELHVDAGFYGKRIIQTGLYQRHGSPLFPQGGAVGIHGTNNPDDLGRAVSNGCIRMQHSDQNKLLKLIHEGTPIKIVA